jgi:hypothetical protein
MSTDCYCALCCGPLDHWRIDRGSKRPEHLDERRRNVENKRRRLAGEDVLHVDTDEGKEMRKNFEVEKGGAEAGKEAGDGAEEDEEVDDDSPWDSDEESDAGADSDNNDESHILFDHHERNSYDPIRLRRKNVKWINRCRVLGINGKLHDERQAFISGQGRLSNNFYFCVHGKSNDPLDPKKDEHPVYHNDDLDETATFPIHEECFRLLGRSLGYRSSKDVDKDVLYAVMMQNTPDSANCLDLDYRQYGNFEGSADQSWKCCPGEEWVATDPGPKPGIEKAVKSMLPAQLFDAPPAQSLNISNKVQLDPLEVLPYDILHFIFSELSMKDTLSLVNASWHVFKATREPAFWRHMIRIHIVPFFYELENFLKIPFPGTFAWKDAFHWLDSITRATYGMDGPLMGIANRRRIWGVCQQLAPLYLEKIHTVPYTDPSDAEAASILEAAKIFHMPVTMFPQPPASDTTIITTQFIRSLSEIGYRACDVETYWTNYSGTLTGMSVNFGDKQRLFGSMSLCKGQSLHIAAGVWMTGIKISVENLVPKYERRKRESFIAVNDGGMNDVGALEEARIQGLSVS